MAGELHNLAGILPRVSQSLNLCKNTLVRVSSGNKHFYLMRINDCYELSVCVPPSSYIGILTPNMVVEGSGAFGR